MFGCFWRFWQEFFENSCCSLIETQKICEIFLRSVWSNFNNFPKFDSTVNIKIFQNWKLLRNSKYTLSPTFFEPSEVAVKRPMMCNVTYYLHKNQVLLWTIHVRCITIGGGFGRNGISILCLPLLLATPSYYFFYFSLFIPKNYNI